MRDVRARDEQDEADRAEQQPKRVLVLADDDVAKRLQADGDVLVDLWIRLRETGVDEIEISLRARATRRPSAARSRA